MSDEPELTADQERAMWRRLACLPHISDEARHAFAIRAAAVANTELAPRLNEAIQRELDARRSGAQLVTTLPPLRHELLDREEWEQLRVNSVPPGLCVSHSLSAAARVSQAEQLTSSGTYMNAVPGFQFRAVSWDRQPPEYVGQPQAPLGQLLSRLFKGAVQRVGFTYHAGTTKRLSIEIDVPSDMTYETLVANLQLVSRELSGKQNTADTGRRILLKLEEEA